MKILKMQEIVLVIILFISFLFFMGNATAAESSTAPNLNGSHINSTTHLTNESNFTSINHEGTKKTQKATNSKLNSGCCSVLLHVRKGVDVFSYRRDSTYAANLHIIKTKWYGKEAVKEYKTTNGYFFHTIIAKNGWIVSAGGPDIVWINKNLESLAGRISVKGHITKADINTAYALLRKAKLGHFLIKDPSGNVGLAIYSYGRSKVKLFKMKEGEYVVVPNNPLYYRQGVINKKSISVSSAVYLAGTNKYGVNRRNVITYRVNTPSSTEVSVWASYDGGKLIRRYIGKPDNIIFRGHEIYAGTLPRIPSRKYIGKISLASYEKASISTSEAEKAKI